MERTLLIDPDCPPDKAPPAGSSAADVAAHAAALQTAGQREADVLQTAGVRNAEVLDAAGKREAAGLLVKGQRKINLVWELTQAVVAIAVTLTTLTVCAHQVINNRGEQGAFLLLSNVFFLVIGNYFQRTNHQKTGGVGAGDVGR